MTAPTPALAEVPADIANPGPPRSPFVDPVVEPAPFSLLPCGCHLRRPDYEAVLCGEHLAELNGNAR